MSKGITKEEFIKRSNEKYDGKYRFYNMEYNGWQSYVWIECQDHGLFKVKPVKHIGRNQECPHCTRELKRQEIEQKILKICSKIPYCDTSRLRYENSGNKLILNCTFIQDGEIHGEYTKLSEEIYDGDGCPKCALIKRGIEHAVSKEEFIRRSKEKHGNLYNYDNIKYTKISEYVYDIWCYEHNGYFNTLAHNHRLYKCNVCYGTETRTTQQFIDEANAIHNYRYDYSNTVYVANNEYLFIDCYVHGQYKRLPTQHINAELGCPDCIREESDSISSGEKEIIDILGYHGIQYITQKSFDDCKHINKLQYDFYLPEYNLCIEYDGQQHFIPIDGWGGEETLKSIQIRDEIKNQYCKNNNINLLRIPYYECNPEEMIEEYFKYVYNKNLNSKQYK